MCRDCCRCRDEAIWSAQCEAPLPLPHPYFVKKSIVCSEFLDARAWEISELAIARVDGF